MGFDNIINSIYSVTMETTFTLCQPVSFSEKKLCGPKILEIYEKELLMPLEICSISSPSFKNHRDSSYKYIRKQ